MKKSFFLLLTGVMLLVMAGSCKKESHDTLPQITINLPAEGTAYNVLDTIDISFSISDKEGLEQYSVTLCNALLVPVQQSVSAPIGGFAANISFRYLIDNVQLTDGNYYVLFAVQDINGNIEKAYRQISITSLPQVRRGFFMVSLPNSNQISVTQVDSAWNTFSAGTFTGDYSASCINIRHQQLYLCGKQTGSFYALALPGGTISWQINPLPSPGDYFTHAGFSNDYVYVSYRDDAVQGYDYTGALRFGATITNGFYPIKSLFVNNRLYVEQKDPGGPARKLVMYNGSTGGGLQETVLSGEVVGFFEKDASNIFVVSNNGNQGKLEIYDIGANGLWEPITLPAGKVLSAAAVDNNTLLIAMSNGNIYRFTYSPLGLLTAVTGVNAQKIRYDAVQSEIIAAQQNMLRTFDYATGTPEQTIVHTDSIANVEVWYNR